MGTDGKPQERRALGSFRKVSKPLMEKKRRARINVSLEQLKALLEKHYSHQIRKRKLEKADILELSVKYMRSLQHSVQGAALPKSADYQAGFRSCLQGVRQSLLRSEAAGDAASFQLLRRVARTGGLGGFSTTDSGAGAALLEPRRGASPNSSSLRRAPPPRMGGKGRAPGGDPSPSSLSSSQSERFQSAQAPLLPDGCQQLWRPW